MARHTEYSLIKQQQKHVKRLQAAQTENEKTCDDVNCDRVFSLLTSRLRKAASVIARVLKHLETNKLFGPVLWDTG